MLRQVVLPAIIGVVAGVAIGNVLTHRRNGRNARRPSQTPFLDELLSAQGETVGSLTGLPDGLLQMAERAAKQDIGTKSCGCIFKNISWSRKGVDRNILLRLFPELLIFKNSSYIPASFLIDQAGLKGKRVGRVFISPKHANYFVNDGGATAEEVVMLISIVKDTVKRKFGLLLGEEIQYVGF